MRMGGCGRCIGVRSPTRRRWAKDSWASTCTSSSNDPKTGWGMRTRTTRPPCGLTVLSHDLHTVNKGARGLARNISKWKQVTYSRLKTPAWRSTLTTTRSRSEEFSSEGSALPELAHVRPQQTNVGQFTRGTPQRRLPDSRFHDTRSHHPRSESTLSSGLPNSSKVAHGKTDPVQQARIQRDLVQ